MSQYEGHALDWDSEISNDGAEFVLLPDGVYPFTVKEITRKDYPGSKKIPACKKIEVVMEVYTPGGQKTTIKDDLILWSTMEWKLASFFVSLGLRKKGESLRPDWNKVPGCSGIAKIKVRTFTKKDNTEGKANDIDRFLAPDPATGSAVAQPQAQQPLSSAAQPSQGWQGGSF